MTSTTETKRPLADLTDLTPEQRDALVYFARNNGRCWKAALLAGWEKSAFPGPLQQIRNSFGPSWLMALRGAK